MKKTLLTLAALAVSVQTFAFDPEPSLKIAGSASEYTKLEYQITEKFGDYYRSPRVKYVHVFDASGHETESSELTSKDSLVDRITYKYEGGNLVETVCADSDGKISWKMVTSYDAAGNKIDESEFNASNTLVNRTIWKINGNQTDESYYNADGEVQIKWNTQYDSKRNRTKISEFYGPNLALEKGEMYEIEYYQDKQ